MHCGAIRVHDQIEHRIMPLYGVVVVSVSTLVVSIVFTSARYKAEVFLTLFMGFIVWNVGDHVGSGVLVSGDCISSAVDVDVSRAYAALFEARALGDALDFCEVGRTIS